MINFFRNRVFCVALAVVATSGNAAPQIAQWQTPRGVPVLFVHAPEIPMVKLRVIFAAGGAYDGAEAGVSSMTSALMGDGTEAMTADEFYRAMEHTGADFGAASTRDMAWISLRSLTDPAPLTRALDLARDALVTPRFAEEDFARLRAQALAGLKQEQSSPNALGDKAIQHALYGEHPYAIPPNGTEDSLAGMTPAALKRFHQRYYVTRNAMVAVVGALSREDVEKLVDTLLAGLPTGEPAPTVPKVIPTKASQVRVTLDGQQSHLLFAQTGIARHDADYFPLVVGNHILGGNGPVSLLFKEIREARGLSYSVASYFEPMAEPGPFIISLQTEYRREAEAQRVLRDTLAKFIAEGPNPAALEAAKQNLIGGFPLRIDSNSKMLEYLTVIGFYRLPLDYLETYPRQVAEVTATQVKEAFARRVNLAAMSQITVGPAPAP